MHETTPTSTFARSGRLRRLLVERPFVVLAAALVVLLGIGLGGVAAVNATPADAPTTLWHAAPSAEPTGASAPATSQPPAATEQVVSMSATGDIIMGDAPGRLPPGGGKGFFNSVNQALAADLAMGNLEEPLTDDTGISKCGTSSSGCHQFRAPPSYAGHLHGAGFDLLNQANNHGYDYGSAGYRNTQEALARAGLRHTGAPGEITVVDIDGVKVAVVGFSSYPWSNSLTDVTEARQVVRRAADVADLVVVQVHMGAEGSDKTHVRPGTEMFLGENRGDPIRFSHAVVDAGADLVVGHGPHVLRGMEFYKGRLIAYSLGNFAGGGGTLSRTGRLGWGGILKVSLRPDGSWGGGEFVPTYLDAAGRPTMDGERRGLAAVRELTRSDFPGTGAKFGGDGSISPPPGP